MRPVPLSAADVLSADFDVFHDTVGSWDNYDRAAFSALHARAVELSKTDVADGNLILAKLASVLGKDEEVERWCRNLEHNNFREQAMHMRFQHFVNMGFATKGQDILPKIIANRSDQNLVHLMHGAIALGAFNAAKNALENADMRKENLGPTNYIDKIKANHPVVLELGLEDAHVARMFDEAGAVLREARRNWASYDLSIIALPRAAGGPAMSVEWPILVSPAEAARLTWLLTDRLVEKELDLPGFSVGFLGLTLQ
ncbi:hypothetical protein ASE28_01415 [Acidovorax sp. Root219]|nr:hypothetical protein ASE28_01415 [Acidovorax sp. Root219]